jgi:hypothetical protein
MRVKGPTTSRITVEQVSKCIRTTIESDAFIQQARGNNNVFVRKRAITLVILLYMMFNLIKSSTQTALDKIFEIIPTRIKTVSQQAFSKARKKLHYLALKYICNIIVIEIYNYGHSRWRGFRILAVDGSKILLPSDKSLRKYFGTFGDDKAITAAGSICYDILNDIIVDARIAPACIDERALALLHVEYLSLLPSFSDELIIFDRGYPGIAFMSDLYNIGITFVIRARRRFNTQIDKMGLGCHNFIMRNSNGGSMKLRVIKFKLKNGKIETLITNLLDYTLGTTHFRNLYFLRWPIETKYNFFKSKLQLENFSTRMVNGIYQEFYTSVIIANIISIMAFNAQPIIDFARRNKKK